jgi:hypothetical protein
MKLKPLSNILPPGDTKPELIFKIRSLFLNEHKKHKDAFLCEMCELLDEDTLKKFILSSSKPNWQFINNTA